MNKRTLDGYIKKGEFYEAVVEDGSDIIFIVDFEGKICYHNDSVREALGYRAKSLVGKNFFDFILPATLQSFRAKFEISKRRGFSKQIEFQFLCKDGTYRFFEFNAINLKHRNGINGLILDCRDITQRKIDAEELLRLQAAKEQFLANISHEIRTPINGIAGLANLLRQDPSKDERETYLNAIISSTDNLKVIINDILDITAIDTGKLQFEKIAFNLSEMLPALINSFMFQAREKRLSLTCAVEERLNVFLLGDPVRLNQILINLISNALKFTHHGSISAEARISRKSQDKVWVQISVKDSGVGIPKEKLSTIFESFSQADASITRKYGGSGLGLTIAKQLVELQGGTISVESRENIGSTFTVTIPYAVSTSENIFRQSPKLDEPLSQIPKLKILLVEDNDVNRLYAESILRRWHCEADTAENGFVAIEKVKGNKYDVILMDVQMPVMDGYEATRAIRMMPGEMAAIPIVALTANATKSDIDKCLVAGMNDFLSKPFTPEDLYNKLVKDLGLGNDDVSTQITPGNDTSDKTKAYDLTYLRSTSQNDENFLRDIIATFTSSTPSILDEMTSLIAKGSLAELGRLAHKLKSSLLLLGMNDLKQQALFIEHHAEDKTRAHEVVAEARSFIETCRASVNALTRDFQIT